MTDRGAFERRFPATSLHTSPYFSISLDKSFSDFNSFGEYSYVESDFSSLTKSLTMPTICSVFLLNSSSQKHRVPENGGPRSKAANHSSGGFSRTSSCTPLCLVIKSLYLLRPYIADNPLAPITVHYGIAISRMGYPCIIGTSKKLVSRLCVRFNSQQSCTKNLIPSDVQRKYVQSFRHFVQLDPAEFLSDLRNFSRNQ